MLNLKYHLQGLERLDTKLVNKIELLNEYEVTGVRAAGGYCERVQSSRVKDNLEKLVLKKMELKEEVGQLTDQFYDLKLDILEKIGQVNDQKQQRLLRLKYLGYMRWEDVAAEMGYTLSNVYKIHEKALNKMKNQKCS